MDTNLTIDSMFFAANIPMSPNPSEPVANPKTNRFAVDYADDSPPPEVPTPQTPDNIPLNDKPQQFQNSVRQQDPDDQQPQEFRNSVRQQAPDDQKPQEFRNETRTENADEKPNEFRHSVRSGKPEGSETEDSQSAVRGKMTIQQHLQLLGHKVSGEVEAKPTESGPDVIQQSIKSQVTFSLQQQNSAKLGLNQNPVNLPAAKGDNNSQVPLQQRVTAQVGQPMSHLNANKVAVTAGQQTGQVVSAKVQAENQNGTKTDLPQSPQQPLNNNLQLGQQGDGAKVPLTNRENLQLQQGVVNEKGPDESGSKTPADQGQKMALGVQKPINDVLSQVQDTKQKMVVGLQTGPDAAPKQTQNKAAVSEQNQAFWQSPNGGGSQQNGKTLGDSLTQQFGQAQVSLQTKERAKVTLKSGLDSDSGHTQTAANAQATVNQQTSTSAQVTAKTTTQLFNNGTYTSVKEQIQSSIQTSLQQGDQQITIRLNPPELGRVCIRFQNQQDQITGFVEVDKARTRYEIEQALPEIIRNLQNSGVQIKRLEVVVNDQAQQEYKEHSLQDAWAWQQNSAEQNRYENATSSQWFTDAENYQFLSESEEIFVTDNSVNMLV